MTAEPCQHIEALLPAFVERDLPEADVARVQRHVRDCPACAESLDAFVALETMLQDRRATRPPARRTAAHVTARLGLGRERRRWYRTASDALTGLPGIISMALVLFGGLQLWFGTRMAEGVGEGTSAVQTAFTSLLKGIGDGLVLATGGHEWVMLSVYAGVLLLIGVSGSWMVLRFVRD